MKPIFKSAIPLTLAAGTFALALGGCGTFDHRDRSADRDANRAAYVASAGSSSNTPATVDPFSPRYAPFPASANESAGVTGHTFYCAQHYNQPGCQTFDTASNDRSFRREHMRRSDAGSVDSSGNRY